MAVESAGNSLAEMPSTQGRTAVVSSGASPRTTWRAEICTHGGRNINRNLGFYGQWGSSVLFLYYCIGL